MKRACLILLSIFCLSAQAEPASNEQPNPETPPSQSSETASEMPKNGKGEVRAFFDENIAPTLKTVKEESGVFFRETVKPALKTVKEESGVFFRETVKPAFHELKAATPSFLEDTVKPFMQGFGEGIVVLWQEGVSPALKLTSKAFKNIAEKAKAYVDKHFNSDNKTHVVEKKDVDPLRLSCLVACSTLLAAAGAKLLYDGITEHEGEIESKPTVKIALGGGFFALALGIILNQ